MNVIITSYFDMFDFKSSRFAKKAACLRIGPGMSFSIILSVKSINVSPSTSSPDIKHQDHVLIPIEHVYYSTSNKIWLTQMSL